MTLNVGHDVAILKGTWKGHYGVIDSGTIFSWRVILDPTLKRAGARETINRKVVIRKTSTRPPTPEEVVENVRLATPVPQSRARVTARTQDNDVDDEEVELLASLVALRLTDDRRYSLFLDELARKHA